MVVPLQWGKENIFNNIARTTGFMYGKKWNLDPYLTPYTNANSKSITGTKLLE